MKIPKDTSKYCNNEVISVDEDNEHRCIRYLISRKETDTEIIERFVDVSDYVPGAIDTDWKHYECKRTFREQKFLCVNGKWAGQRRTYGDATANGYVQYNRADKVRVTKGGGPKSVLISFDSIAFENNI